MKLLGNNEEEQNARAAALREQVYSLYSYLYIPVEESPTELLQLQNDTMQKLLNKDVLQEMVICIICLFPMNQLK